MPAICGGRTFEKPVNSRKNGGGLHMTRGELAPEPSSRRAVIDTDSGFVPVLAKRAEAAGWLLRTSGGADPPDQLVAMKLNALLVDPAVLGDEAWRYLDRVCSLF